MRKEDYNNSNDNGKEDAHTPPSYHNSDLYNRINGFNDKHHNSAYTKHHAVSNQERERYQTSKLNLNENPLLQKEDRKQNLMNVLLKLWDVLDYYNERIPSTKTNV